MLTRRLIVFLKKARLASASYVVMPFLPLLCDVRRPRAGCSRPGVTVSGAPAKLLPTATLIYRKFDCLDRPPFLGSLTYPTFFFLPASYVVMPFLPLLCDVRRPRAGCSRPGVTVSGAPAKLRYYKRIAIPYN
ncbi:hypothetical protein L249_2545 [Ophiocordyceps polyrhachis-furcata BCC 54312]|uniref:Uncharacterized protein n=1 Tax=Ophiocordyceps polyrhachis-furcata BCC 54312 TaxID=1330021 RepID=A0A367LQP6_9HYPO|nr:hypothetical protein L249_2545 [Ophiocordyceps polyrhachis-furcata BCC 54312]